mgnify:CR=1 FL=1
MTAFWHCPGCNDWTITDVTIPRNVYHLNPQTGQQCDGSFVKVPVQKD